MTRRPSPDNEPRRAGRYAIRVRGHLDARWEAWFEGLRLRHETDGVTVIDGLLADQAALHGVLQRVRDIGLPLISVTRIAEEARGTDPGSPPPSDPHHLPFIERNDEP